MLKIFPYHLQIKYRMSFLSCKLQVELFYNLNDKNRIRVSQLGINYLKCKPSEIKEKKK